MILHLHLHVKHLHGLFREWGNLYGLARSPKTKKTSTKAEAMIQPRHYTASQKRTCQVALARDVATSGSTVVSGCSGTQIREPRVMYGVFPTGSHKRHRSKWLKR